MTSAYNEPSETALRSLLDRASCLLLDFDGPLCRLFSDGHAPDIAEWMLDLLAGFGVELDRGLRESLDPHSLVKAPLPPHITRLLESRLTEEEEVAALSAVPTPGAADFVRAAVARGRTLAITTNNAPRAVETYLKTQGLEDAFAGRIFGRRADNPGWMKPHPDCLRRAVEAVGADRAQCLMIGDSIPDARAADAAGVPFLGYASGAERVARLAGGAGPGPVVVGMAPLVRAMRAARPVGPPNG